MTAPVGLPFGRPLTVDDLESVPDDGHRYELLDGTLLVTPGPAWNHQAVGLALAMRLESSCPPGLRVLELRDGGYREVANLQPDDTHDFERPFRVQISMRELCQRLDPD